MGMFDNINYDGKCKKCNDELNWQSKDGDCLLRTLEPKDVNNFYSLCDKCGTWNEKEVNNINGELVIKDSLHPEF